MSNAEPRIEVLERPARVCALAVRFWDEVSQDWIRDGLVVSASSERNPASRVRSVCNPSGFYSFHHLPGMAAFEHGDGDAAFWAKPHAKQTFILEVFDRARRFLAMRIAVSAPIRIPGEHAAAAPTGFAPERIPLFSSPGRSIPTGMAAIRADLRDPLGNPAAWAVLEAHPPGQPPTRGVSDSLGRVLLMFPYPEPVDVLVDAPHGGILSPLTEQTWTVGLEAQYGAIEPGTGLPDLLAVLTQPAAELLADNGSPSRPLKEAKLTYGRELIVGSIDSTSGKPLSQLLITSAP